jgi:hypothetical protein
MRQSALTVLLDHKRILPQHKFIVMILLIIDKTALFDLLLFFWAPLLAPLLAIPFFVWIGRGFVL